MNANNIIKTHYNGITYRSRTEARWAVLLDCMGVRKVYEAEGFCADGYSYLPDFYLEDEHLYIEVKPHPEARDLRRIQTFCDRIEARVLVVGDIPENFVAPRGWAQYDWVLYTDYFISGTKLTRIPVLDDCGKFALMSDVDALKSADIRRTFNCYAAARNAKFEHGEKPKAGAAA